MSSSDAQRSSVHQSTEDSSREPTGPIAPPQQRAAVATDQSDARNDAAGPGPVRDAGLSAADASRGGGAGTGIPGGPDMHTDGAFNGGNADEDRKRLFPDSSSHPGQESSQDDRNSSDPDESSYGGPLKLDDTNPA